MLASATPLIKIRLQTMIMARAQGTPKRNGRVKVSVRVEHFAKFREMQKMVLQKRVSRKMDAKNAKMVVSLKIAIFSYFLT